MAASNAPPVGIAMGSDSDLPVMEDAAEVLDEFDVSYEMRVLSAHRTPGVMKEYAETAQEPPTCPACSPPAPPSPSSACL